MTIHEDHDALQNHARNSPEPDPNKRLVEVLRTVNDNVVGPSVGARCRQAADEIEKLTDALKRTVEELETVERSHKSIGKSLAHCGEREGMKGLLADVTEFHHATDTPVLDKLTCEQLPSVAERRRNLICEEAIETVEAIDADDLVKIADGLADLIYVAVGTALEYGIPLDRVWAEVHRSNMAKRDPAMGVVRREDGKILKPKGWTPPDIAGALGLPDQEREFARYSEAA